MTLYQYAKTLFAEQCAAYNEAHHGSLEQDLVTFRRRNATFGQVWGATAGLRETGFIVGCGASCDANNLNEHVECKMKPVTVRAKGTFEVELRLQGQDDDTGESLLGRFLIDKRFSGDLEATSQGQMLSARTAVPESAGYVAIEQVEGNLHGCKGTFVLQHTGTATREGTRLSITVVPDSGTGELVGLAGSMTIEIADGKHFYDFEYTLPETR